MLCICSVSVRENALFCWWLVTLVSFINFSFSPVCVLQLYLSHCFCENETYVPQSSWGFDLCYCLIALFIDLCENQQWMLLFLWSEMVVDLSRKWTVWVSFHMCDAFNAMCYVTDPFWDWCVRVEPLQIFVCVLEHVWVGSIRAAEGQFTLDLFVFYLLYLTV